MTASRRQGDEVGRVLRDLARDFDREAAKTSRAIDLKADGARFLSGAAAAYRNCADAARERANKLARLDGRGRKR